MMLRDIVLICCFTSPRFTLWIACKFPRLNNRYENARGEGR